MNQLRTVKAKCRPTEPGKKFLPYQERWVKDRSRIKLVEKSRQVGFSYATAFDIVRESARREAKLDSWISSRDEMQARLFIEDCKKFADPIDRAARAIGEQLYKDEGGKPYTSFDLKFSNGISIHSMSSNPDAQAGKRGTRVLDEFALHPDPVKLYAIAYPGITWGGQMAIISTHRGAKNFFNLLVDEARNGGNPKKISLHRVTLEDALYQGFLFKLQQELPEDDPRQDMDEAAYFDDVKSRCSDRESFLQEYMCVPADDAGAFIPYDILRGCFYGFAEVWETDLENCAGDLYIGVDVGRVNDLTVIWVLEKIAGFYFTRRVIELKNESFSAQESILWPLIALPKVRRVGIDQTGLGRQFAERAQERFGTSKVEGVTFTAGNKEAMAYPLKSALEDGILKMPDSDAVRADFRSVRKTSSATGAVRFLAERDGNGHADRFWACALALNAGAKPNESYFVPIERRSDRRFF